MNRYWSAIWRAVNAVPPAMRGRIIRHVLTLLAGAGLIRGLTADQANAWQGLVELALSAVGFVLAVYLSQRSDAKQLAKVKDPLTDAEIDAIVREVCRDQPANLTGKPDAIADANDSYRPPTPPSVPPAGGAQ